MATYYSPKIVTDGLLICLDPSNTKSYPARCFVSAKIYSTYNGGVRSANYTVQYSDDNTNWTTAFSGVARNNESGSATCGVNNNTGSGNGSYGRRRYWRYVEGSAVVSHHPRVSRIILVDETNTEYNLIIYVSDNCSDSGTYIVGTVSVDVGSSLCYDLCENAINGTLYNGSIFNTSNAGSFIFDGVDDFISTNNTLQDASYGVGNLFADNTTAFSVSAWYKFPISPTQARSDAVNGGNCSYAIAGAGGGIGGAETFNMFVGGTNAGNFYLNNTWVGCRGAKTLISSSTVNTNTWNQSVVTWNGTTGAVYHNGIYQRALNVGSAGLQGYYFTVGSIANGSGPHCFEGSISQVLVHKKSLSAAEVLQNYNATKGRFGL